MECVRSLTNDEEELSPVAFGSQLAKLSLPQPLPPPQIQLVRGLSSCPTDNKESLAALVLQALQGCGWADVRMEAMIVVDCSGCGGSKTFKVTGPGGSPPAVALKRRSLEVTSDPVSEQRAAAASQAFAQYGLAPPRLAEGGDWFIEAWEGNKCGEPSQLLKPWSMSEPSVHPRKCASPGCDFFAHTDLFNNGGLYCCRACRSYGSGVEVTAWEVSLWALHDGQFLDNDDSGSFKGSAIEAPWTIEADTPDDRVLAPGMTVHIRGRMGKYLASNGEEQSPPIWHNEPSEATKWELHFDVLGEAWGRLADDTVVSIRRGGSALDSNVQLDSNVLTYGNCSSYSWGGISPDLQWNLRSCIPGAYSPPKEVAEHSCLCQLHTFDKTAIPPSWQPIEQRGATVAEMGTLLAKIHRIPTDWYNPWLEKLCKIYPGLDAEPRGVHIWFSTARRGMLKGLDSDEEAMRAWATAGPRPHSRVARRIVTCHMDFHPANTLRTLNGELVVVDFEFSAVNYALWDFMYASWLWCKTLECQRAFLQAYLQEAGEPSGTAEVDEILADMRVVGHCHHELPKHLAQLRMFPGDGLADYRVLSAAAEDVLSSAELRRQALQGKVEDISLIGEAMKAMQGSSTDLWQNGVLVTFSENPDGLAQGFAVNWDGSLTPLGRRRGKDLALGLNDKGEVILVSILQSSAQRLRLRMDQSLPVTGVCAPSGPILPLRLKSHSGCGLVASSSVAPKCLCDSGTKTSWEESKQHAERHGGRLFTLQEVQTYFEGNPAVAPGEDQWAACINDKAHDLRDWVQIGDICHHPGKSHVDECGGYPGDWWGTPQRWDCQLWRVPEACADEGCHLVFGPTGAAVECFFDGAYVRLASRPLIALECANKRKGCFVTLAAHRPGNASQQFVVDVSGIVCLKVDPDLVWGMTTGLGDDAVLQLVPRGSHSQVILDLPERFLPQVAPTEVSTISPSAVAHFRFELASHPGQAVVVKKTLPKSDVDILELGPVEAALDCTLDGQVIRLAGSVHTLQLSSPAMETEPMARL